MLQTACSRRSASGSTPKPREANATVWRCRPPARQRPVSGDGACRAPVGASERTGLQRRREAARASRLPCPAVMSLRVRRTACRARPAAASTWRLPEVLTASTCSRSRSPTTDAAILTGSRALTVEPRCETFATEASRAAPRSASRPSSGRSRWSRHAWRRRRPSSRNAASSSSSVWLQRIPIVPDPSGPTATARASSFSVPTWRARTSPRRSPGRWGRSWRCRRRARP
jgi:hypothetical protein